MYLLNDISEAHFQIIAQVYILIGKEFSGIYVWSLRLIIDKSRYMWHVELVAEASKVHEVSNGKIVLRQIRSLVFMQKMAVFATSYKKFRMWILWLQSKFVDAQCIFKNVVDG